jgi:hypothetical protein
MSDNPKRRWLHFHLATAVLMMLAAGALLFANCYSHKAPPDMNGTWSGFPFPAYSNLNVIRWDYTNKALVLQHDSYAKICGIQFSFNENGWCYTLAAANFVLFLLAITVIAFVSEYIIRRRWRRKPN